MTLEHIEHSEEDFHHKLDDVLIERNQPKNVAELQPQLIEEYYLSVHPHITPEQFAHDNVIQLDAMHAWASGGQDSLAAKFGRMKKDKNLGKDILDTTLDDVLMYQG